jgi:hypothetical protein
VSHYKRRHGPSNGKTHAHERAWQRHGIDFDPSDIRQIIRDIGDGAALFVGNGGGGCDLYEVLVKGRLCRIVFDPKRKFIVTVLPPRALGESR